MGTVPNGLATQVGEWSGEYELQNARIPVEGLAEPVRVQSAMVSLNGKRVSVNKMRAKAGTIAFTGDYRWEPAAIRPHKFHLTIPAVDAAELQRVLTPSLVRDRGFFARTLRFGDGAGAGVAEGAPGGRHGVDRVADVRRYESGGRQRANSVGRGASARARLERARGSSGAGRRFEHRPDGSHAALSFRGQGSDVAYKEGTLDFEGSLDADGAGPEILASAHAEGRVHGRSIMFSPDAEFRTASACFEVTEQSAGERWKLSSVEVTQGADTYTGSGVTQTDGRLVLDLLSRGRPVRYSTLLVASGTQ